MALKDENRPTAFLKLPESRMSAHATLKSRHILSPPLLLQHKVVSPNMASPSPYF